MRNRVLNTCAPFPPTTARFRSWSLAWLLAAAALLAPASLTAQTFRAPQIPGADKAAGAIDRVQSAIGQLLQQGQSLETTGRWAEALTYYEEALREHPDDPTLQDRFDVARLHYSFEQRYDDRSFRDSVQNLRPRQALDQYTDLLNKIGAHYYTTPPWQDLTRRGARALKLALADDKFLRTHGIRVRGAQIDALQQDIDALSKRYAIRSSSDAAAVASQIARLASARIGLGETATLLEFTAAAAGGLDHYSAYLTADQLRDIYSQIEGNFVGLGVELKADDDALLIVNVIPNSPAEAAGIVDGDRIVAISGQSLQDMSTDQAAALLTGEEGSLVRVTVITAAQAPRDLIVRRAHVDVPSLEDVKIIEPATGVAYVRIPAFQKTTARDLEAALWDLHDKGMRSLVIDLRGNPGGLLTASVEVADKFIAAGGIVSTRGRSEQENFNYSAHRPGTWRVPLVVLIDGDSASASEIFAGAIKDAHRGKIVGSRSYGKGSVQGIFHGPLLFTQRQSDQPRRRHARHRHAQRHARRDR
jgi:carboxyl-terminal processing protease